MGKLTPAEQFIKSGLTTIAKAEGIVLVLMDEQIEGIAIADVTLDSSKKVLVPLCGYGRNSGGFVTRHCLNGRLSERYFQRSADNGRASGEIKVVNYF